MPTCKPLIFSMRCPDCADGILGLIYTNYETSRAEEMVVRERGTANCDTCPTSLEVTLAADRVKEERL